MTVRIAKIPEPVYQNQSKSLVLPGITQIVKGVATNLAIPDNVTDQPLSQSYLDTPVMDNLEFPQGAYTDLQDNTITYGAVTIDTVIFEVNRPRNIVKTPIQGRDGTIKEYVSSGDYQITCRGIISNRDNVFPLDQIRGLIKVLEVPQQIPIVSLFLNDVFEIFNVVIERYSVPQVEGKRNEIPFSFVASSDVSIDVQELE